MGRGQVSVEYMVIVAIALGLLVPAVIFFYTYTKSADPTSAQLNEAGLQMIAAVKSTYALGLNARQTVEFTMPATVVNVTVNDRELVFRYHTAEGISEAVFFSTIGMEVETAPGVYSPAGPISVPRPGLTRYRFTSRGPTVVITEMT